MLLFEHDSTETNGATNNNIHKTMVRNKHTQTQITTHMVTRVMNIVVLVLQYIIDGYNSGSPTTGPELCPTLDADGYPIWGRGKDDAASVAVTPEPCHEESHKHDGGCCMKKPVAALSKEQIFRPFVWGHIAEL